MGPQIKEEVLCTASPARGEPLCDKVPMLPVRYALSSEKEPPIADYNSFKWPGVSSAYYKGTLRGLYGGWVHLWSELSFPGGKSFEVSKAGKIAGKEWLLLPLADANVWMAYSQEPWSDKVWERICTDAKKREKRMRKIQPRKMAATQGEQNLLSAVFGRETHCAPIQHLGGLVEEYRERPGFLYGLEELPHMYPSELGTRSIFDPDLAHWESHEPEAVDKRWQYSKDKFNWRRNSKLEERMRMASCGGNNPFFTALDDPVGTAMEYASIHAGYCGMQDMMQDWYAHPSSSATACCQLWQANVLSEFFSYQTATHDRSGVFVKRMPCAEEFLRRRFAENSEIGNVYFRVVLEPWMKHMQEEKGCSMVFAFECDFSDEVPKDAELREKVFGLCLNGFSAHAAGARLIREKLLPVKGPCKGVLGRLLLKVAASPPLERTTKHTESWVLALSNVLILPDKKGRLPESHRELFAAVDHRLPEAARLLAPPKLPSTNMSPDEQKCFYAHTIISNMEILLYGEDAHGKLGSIYDEGMTFSPGGMLRPTSSEGALLIDLPNQNNVVMFIRQKVLRGDIVKFSEYFAAEEPCGNALLSIPLSEAQKVEKPEVYTFMSIFWPFSLISTLNKLNKADDKDELAKLAKVSLMVGCQAVTSLMAKKVMKTAATHSLAQVFARLGSLKALSVPWQTIMTRAGGILASTLGSGISMTLAWQGHQEADENSYPEKLGYGLVMVGNVILLFTGPGVLLKVRGAAKLLTAGKWITLSGMFLALLGQKRPIHSWLEKSYWGKKCNAMAGKNPEHMELYSIYEQYLSIPANYGYPKFSLKDDNHMYRSADEVAMEKAEMDALLRATLGAECEMTPTIAGDSISIRMSQAIPWKSRLKIYRDNVEIKITHKETKKRNLGDYFQAPFIHAFEGIKHAVKGDLQDYLMENFPMETSVYYELFKDNEERWKAVKDLPGRYVPTLFDEAEWVTYQDENGNCCWRCYFKDFGAALQDWPSLGTPMFLIIPIRFTYSDTITFDSKLVVPFMRRESFPRLPS